MSQTVIGVFDSQTHAQQAVQSLMQRGFPQAHITLHGHGAPLDAPADGASRAPGVVGLAGTGTLRHADDEHQSFVTRIEHFIGRFFGRHNDDPNEAYSEDRGHYAEAVRRGGTLVAIESLNDDQIDDARTALWQSGAVDIDERVAHWREHSGYSRYDSGSPPYSTEQAEQERLSFAARQRASDTPLPDSALRPYPGRSPVAGGTTVSSLDPTGSGVNSLALEPDTAIDPGQPAVTPRKPL